MQRTIIPEQVSQHLRIEHKAREEGIKKQPPADATTFDGPQAEILAYFTDALKEIRDGYIERLNRTRTERKELANKIDVVRAKNQFQQIGDDVEASLMQLRVENEGGLARSVDGKERAQRHLNAFRHKHDLVTIEPSYPDSMWDHLSLVALAALGEWLLLSYFYKGIGSGGFVEGFFYASLFSIVNLLLAIILGNVLRQYNLPSISRKLLATAGAGILIATFLFVTILVAHFRYAAMEYKATQTRIVIEANQGVAAGNAAGMRQAVSALSWDSAKEIGNKAWDRAKLDWRNLPDPLAWIVVVATCLFGGLAAWKGYRMDDRFPGYGDLHRDFRKKDFEYEETKKSYGNLISGLFEVKQRAQESIFSETDGNIQRFGRICGTARAEVQKFESERVAVRDNCNAVLNIYRDANKYVRGSSTPPAYFDKNVELDEAIARDLHDVADLLESTEMEKQYSNSLSEFSALAAQSRKEMNLKKTDGLREFQRYVASLEVDIRQSLIEPPGSYSNRLGRSPGN